MKVFKIIIISLYCFLLAGTMAAQTEAETPAPVEQREMNYVDALILGVVEGITEYLPISSTGHLLLTNSLLGLDSTTPMLGDDGLPLFDAAGEPITMKQAADAYAIVIQAGAILAVVILYWSRIWQVIMGVLGFSPHGRLLARNLILAFIPAAVLGLLLNDIIEHYLFSPLPIAIALAAGGFLMLITESWRKTQTSGGDSEISLHALGVRQSLFIGLLQCVAMWPGTSRSMMTIVGGYLVGLTPARAAEFSFLLGLITLTAASGYTTVRSGATMVAGLDLGPVLVGIVVSFIAAALSIRWLVAYLTRHGLALFAWYRFALAAAVIYFLVL